MPGSRINGKDEIKKFVTGKKDIHYIVDVGPGEGTYAKLLGPGYKYIGIEIFEPYVDKFKLKELYSKIIIADVTQLPKLPIGDCVIFGDVLEHIEKLYALNLLKKAEYYYKHIVVSLPLSNEGEVVPGKIHYGNKHEAHVSGWTWRECLQLFKLFEIKIESKGIGVFCK